MTMLPSWSLLPTCHANIHTYITAPSQQKVKNKTLESWYAFYHTTVYREWLATYIRQVIWAKLIRCATAYSSSCSQIALVLVVYLHLFHQNLRLKCVPHPKIAKNTKTPYFGSSRLFKVIDADTTKKLVTSDCYGKQHVCTYVQPLSSHRSQ